MQNAAEIIKWTLNAKCCRDNINWNKYRFDSFTRPVPNCLSSHHTFAAMMEQRINKTLQQTSPLLNAVKQNGLTDKSWDRHASESWNIFGFCDIFRRYASVKYRHGLSIHVMPERGCTGNKACQGLPSLQLCQHPHPSHSNQNKTNRPQGALVANINAMKWVK